AGLEAVSAPDRLHRGNAGRNLASTRLLLFASHARLPCSLAGPGLDVSFGACSKAAQAELTYRRWSFDRPLLLAGSKRHGPRVLSRSARSSAVRAWEADSIRHRPSWGRTDRDSSYNAAQLDRLPSGYTNIHTGGIEPGGRHRRL